jgi:transcriptional regulator with XRE-family HTH domain
VPSANTVNRKDGGVEEDQQDADLTLEQALGRVLRGLRLRRGLFQVDVAAATGFGIRSIRTMESGQKSMRLRSLDALSDYYGTPLEDLIISAKRLRGR